MSLLKRKTGLDIFSGLDDDKKRETHNLVDVSLLKVKLILQPYSHLFAKGEDRTKNYFAFIH